MAEKENILRVTRSSKRKAAETSTPTPTPDDRPKKRVVLGELPNLQNPDAVIDPNLKPKPNKPKRKVKSKNSAGTSSSSHADIVVKPTIDEVFNDPQLCVAYAFDIYEYLRNMEADPRKRALPDYMARVQSDISANMRGILVDWLVEVAEEYRLVSDTLYLSISYIDRFLSVNDISRHKLQLLGVSSMLIASKYEEISPPHVEEFVYITDNTYNREEVVKMEADILKSLEFELGNPTTKTFLRRFAGFAQEDYENTTLQFEYLGYYLAELSLLDYNCVKFLPSLVAASVIFLARFMIHPKMHPWSLRMHQCIGYKPPDLKDCVLLIHDLYLSRRGGTLLSIRDKYKQHKFKCVAIMSSPPEIPVSYFEDVRV